MLQVGRENGRAEERERRGREGERDIRAKNACLPSALPVLSAQTQQGRHEKYREETREATDAHVMKEAMEVLREEVKMEGWQRQENEGVRREAGKARHGRALRRGQGGREACIDNKEETAVQKGEGGKGRGGRGRRREMLLRQRRKVVL